MEIKRRNLGLVQIHNLINCSAYYYANILTSQTLLTEGQYLMTNKYFKFH